eukprot:PhF_6_TR8722/c1_g1_i2/m.13692/K06173/truA, PUS1; tRNA pseudouridine38-40 synthase
MSIPPPPPTTTVAFRLVTPSEWEGIQRDGVYLGSAIDVKDGYMHLSQGNEVRPTAEKYFKGTSVVLLRVDLTKIDTDVRYQWDWVESRNAYFPHLYPSRLTASAITSSTVVHPSTPEESPKITDDMVSAISTLNAPATNQQQDSDRDDDKDDKRGGGKRKIKIALLVGYIGTNYHGSQYNKDPLHPSVEEILFNAICKGQLISEVNQKGEWTKKIGWQRASRTDKGVHALRNIISLKLPEPPGGIDAIPTILQPLLPADIRVFGALTVTRSFSSYEDCTSRVYWYVLPPYALLGPELYSALPRDPTDPRV